MLRKILENKIPDLFPTKMTELNYDGLDLEEILQGYGLEDIPAEILKSVSTPLTKESLNEEKIKFFTR